MFILLIEPTFLTPFKQKKMALKNVWIIPAIIIGYIFYKKYVLSQKASVSFHNLDFSKMSFTNPELGLVVEISNPSDTTAQIDDINGKIIVDGIEVGRVFGITPTKINTGSSLLRIPATLSYQGVGELIKKYNSKGFKFEFIGTITIDLVTVPLEFSYNV